MTTPYKLLAICGLLLGVFFSGWHLGSKLKQGEWDAERASSAVALASAIADGNAKVLATEHAMQARIAGIGTVYESKLKVQQDEKTRLQSLNASRGMFVNVTAPACPSAERDASTPASRGDGQTRVRLSEKDGDFLVSLATDADQVAGQLAACQAVVLLDRVVK